MKNLTVLIILAVVAALVAFIFFVERDTMTTAQRGQRENRLFREYDREAVTRLSVRRATGETIVLEKTATPGEDEGVWRIKEPRQRDAEQTEVRAILSSIDFLLVGRSVDKKQAADIEGFGLDKPRLEVSFDFRGKRTMFRLGADAPGEKVYLAIDGEDSVVYAVAGDILEALDKGEDELRSKRLSPERLGEAVSLAVSGPLGDYRLSRAALLDPWHLETSDGKVLASAGAVGELLNHLDGLRARSFVADDLPLERLGEHGLASPAASATVTLPGGQTARILVGASCGEGAGEVGLTFEGSGTVACVEEQVLRLLSRPKDMVLERRPLVVRGEEAKGISLRHGTARLELEKKDGVWIAPSHEGLALEQRAVEELIEALGQASSQAPVLGKVEQVPSSATTLELDIGEGLPRQTLAVWRGQNGEILARRGQEPALIQVSSRLEELARADILAFRQRTVRYAQPDEVTALAIEGPAAQSAVRKDGKWTLVTPIAAAADSAGARQLAELLAEISAVRYVAAAPAAEHGLNRPYAVLRATFAAQTGEEKEGESSATKTVELRLGALVPGKSDERFAQKVDDSLVFVVGRSYLEAAERLLLARDVLTVDETAVRRLTVAVGKKSLSWMLDGETWVASDNAPVDQERLRRLMTDFGTVKTVRTAALGKDASSMGPPAATVALFLQDEDNPLKRFMVGSRTPQSDEDGYYVRVEGLEATVVMPRRVVDGILSLVSP
jgi:hypothetical protein